MQPLISIIIPVWNVDKFLEKCLDSLQRQTYQNLQIILIDDGSEDISGEICDVYAEKDSRIEVIHQENAGVCHARNTGLARVRGEYIGFVDPDDWAAPDMFEYLLNGITEYQADIACCRYYRVTEGEEIYSQCDGEDCLLTSEEAVRELVNRFILRNVFWNKLFRREIFEGITFPEGMIYEGTALVYKLFLRANRIVSLGKPQYYYVDNPNSYINRNTIKHAIDFVKAHIMRYQDLEEKFPELKKKLWQDLMTVVFKFQYLYRRPEREIEDNRRGLEEIRDFILQREDEIEKELELTKQQKKQLKFILQFTKAGLKKARKIAAIEERKDRILGSLKVGNSVRREIPDTVSYERKLYKQINQKILRELQLCELDILKQVDAICKKNNLQYYLYGGTLLGAIRHKGFIPWDDDVDIVMPMKDYMKFLDIAEEELGKKYFCQTSFSDDGFPYLYAKVRREDSYVCEEKWKDKEMHTGVYIDILPLAGIPDGKIFQKIFLHLMSLMHQVCAFERPKTKKWTTKLCFYLLKRLPLKTRYRMRAAIMKLSDRLAGNQYVCSYGSHYMPVQRRILKKEWFAGKKTFEFEGEHFYIPDGWEKYLEHLFGKNYMQLPPEEQRETHLMLSRSRIPADIGGNQNEAV